jgi:hypothetical protein
MFIPAAAATEEIAPIPDIGKCWNKRLRLRPGLSKNYFHLIYITKIRELPMLE